MVYGHVAFFAGGNEPALIERMVGYFSTALQRDGAGLMVTSASRHHEVTRRLPASASLEFVDAEKALDLIYRNGRIDPHAFNRHIGDLVRRVVHQNGARNVYAYGDMVDILSARGERNAAAELECFWNDLGAQLPFRLFCGYLSVQEHERHDSASELARLHTSLME